jgi:hypothetical protein
MGTPILNFIYLFQRFPDTAFPVTTAPFPALPIVKARKFAGDYRNSRKNGTMSAKKGGGGPHGVPAQSDDGLQAVILADSLVAEFQPLILDDPLVRPCLELRWIRHHEIFLVPTPVFLGHRRFCPSAAPLHSSILSNYWLDKMSRRCVSAPYHYVLCPGVLMAVCSHPMADYHLRHATSHCLEAVHLQIALGEALFGRRGSDC